KLSQYGSGWMLDQHPKLGKVVRHTGDNPGYKTQFIRYIDANKTAIVLCNNDHPRLLDLVKLINEVIPDLK
ncbi:MAG: serine hydrolase, partial [Siphonobacter sp.]